MPTSVEIEFDCLPLRSITRLDVPLDASPKYRQKCERLKAALERHGSHNSYYLHNARCKFFLTNSTEIGTLEFSFEGTILTDTLDLKALESALDVQLVRETCDWLTEPVVAWFKQTVTRAALVEFDRYIEAGDLKKAIERLEKLQAEVDRQGGYMGMYL